VWPLLAQAQTPDSLLEVVPGLRIGPIGRAASAASLQRLLGSAVVQVTRLDDLGGEGGTTPGVILWPADSSRRAVVYWADTVSLSHPALVIVSADKSHWFLPAGLHVGMPLQDVERVNQKPFTFLGFGWDLGGRSTDWRGGALDELRRQGLSVSLELDPGCLDQLAEPERTTLIGDVELSSDAPTARRACIVVTSVLMGFP
jgi:hypothetical protein